MLVPSCQPPCITWEIEQPWICKQKQAYALYKMKRKGKHECLHDSHRKHKTLTYIWCYDNTYDVDHCKIIDISKKKLYSVQLEILAEINFH